jgi:hypothetical protein
MEVFMDKRLLLLVLAAWALPLTLPAKTISTCDQYQAVTVGSYVVQTDYWNKGQCPGTQCVNIDDETGAYTVTQVAPNCSPKVSSYPSIMYGKGWYQESPHCDLPARISSLKNVLSDWDFSPTYAGSWDAAYDIWFCPDNSCGVTGFTGGAEMMIWVDYQNTHGWQDDQGPVTLEGNTWEVWKWKIDNPTEQRIYVAYLAKNLAHSVTNLDLTAFFKDSEARGFIQPSWYLYAVEAGIEIADRGVPFTCNHFSVSVNQKPATKANYGFIPTFTPTPIPTPDMSPIPPPP